VLLTHVALPAITHAARPAHSRRLASSAVAQHPLTVTLHGQAAWSTLQNPRNSALTRAAGPALTDTGRLALIHATQAAPTHTALPAFTLSFRICRQIVRKLTGITPTFYQ
jgi:hypothetical protein